MTNGLFKTKKEKDTLDLPHFHSSEYNATMDGRPVSSDRDLEPPEIRPKWGHVE
jgi:hypothetical protein